MAFEQLGDVSLTWGESLRWDDKRQRLYFVDCATQSLYWLDDGETQVGALKMPSMPAGVVIARDGRLVICLDDGLHVVDVDRDTVELLAPYPPELGARANDAAADLDGNLVTGTLNLLPGPGSYWWYSADAGWRKLDEGIGNANGPVVIEAEGSQRLVFADTLADTIYAYPYNGVSGAAGSRSVFASTADVGGAPDGACADSEGGIWSCILGAGRLVRYTSAGVDTVLDAGVELPSDVTFGGPNLDRLFLVSIAISIGGIEVQSSNAGRLLVLEGSGFHGRPETRFEL